MGLFSSPYHSHAWESLETPASYGKNHMVLQFMIPNAPYSDSLMKTLHKVFDAVEGAHATLEIFGVEVAGLLGVAMPIVAGAAGFIANLLALGAGYAEARDIVSKRAVISGFAHGVAMGADRRSWKYAKDMFWQNNPYRYDTPMDEAIGKIGQKSFNLGLVSGFIQGRQLTAPGKPSTLQEQFFWKSIGQAMTPGDRVKYGGDAKQWPKSLWSDWYITVAGVFAALYVKTSE